MSSAYETHERIHEHGHEGPRWIPLAAAVLAVLAAFASLLGNVRATAANAAKSDAIVARTVASDAYNEYESRSIKAHLADAFAAAVPATASGQRAVAAHERDAGTPALARAREREAESERDLARAERALHGYETIEIGATLLEIAIVLVSIAALVAGRALPLAAAVAAGLGLLVAIVGWATSA